MKAGPVVVGTLLQNRQRFCVPIYQRHYVWTREKQWNPFWEDVRTKAMERLSDRRRRYSHFMGAVVLEAPGGFSARRVQTFQVVDGQQRLTTFQLFLAAARDYANHSGFANVADQIRGYLLNGDTHLMEEPAVEELKVWPTQFDRELFIDIVRFADRRALREKYEDHFYKTRDQIYDYKHTPRLIAGYGYFYDQIRYSVESDDLDDPFAEEPHTEEAADEESPKQGQARLATEDDAQARIEREIRLNAIWQALVEEFKVVEITLEEGDDAQVIFETLNERGEPLLAADLIRNNIFQRADAQRENADKLFMQHWKAFEDPSWTQDEKQGRYKKARIEFFLANFIAGQIGGEVSLSKLFSEYKALLRLREQSPEPTESNQHPHPRRFPKIVDELEELGRYGETYRRLVDDDAEGALADFARRLRPWEVTTIFPLVLRLWQHPALGEAGKRKCLDHLMSFIVRRAVCGLTTKNYNKFFLNVVAYLDSNGWSHNEFVGYLARQTAETARIPNDREFASRWLSEPLYETLRSARVRQILEELEQGKRTTYHETTELRHGLTVEHVMPVNWRENWPLANGEAVTSAMEGDALIADIMGAEDESMVGQIVRRNRLKHTVGNLTLLTQPLNSSVSNASFNIKKVALNEHSLLVLNRELVAHDRWAEDTIEVRSEELFKLALQIWPYLQVEDQVVSDPVEVP